MLSIPRKDDWDSVANTILAGALILTIVLLMLAKPTAWLAAAAGLTASLTWTAPRAALARRTA